MPIDQLFRALPVVLVLGTLPGLALATLISPRLPWALRLAAAPGFSVASVGVAGLVLYQFGIPFSPLSIVPILAVLVGAAVARHLRRGKATPGAPGIGVAVGAVALAAGVVLVGVAAGVLHDDVLPPADDAAYHGNVAAAIARDDNVLPAVPLPLLSGSFVRLRAAFEATDALASQLGAGTPADLLMPLTVVSLLVLPLGVAVLAYEAFPDRRVAAAAALLTFGFAFPAIPIGIGDYPYIAASTLVVPLILGGARLLRATDRQAGALLVGAAVLAIWVIHGLEILTAVAVGGPLWLALIATRRRAALSGAVIGVAATAAGVVLGYVLTRAPAAPAAATVPAPTFNQAAVILSGHAGVGIGDVLNSFAGTELSVLSGLLLAAGIIAVFVRRQARWLLLSLVIPLLCLFDVAGPELLHRLWMAVYPWSVEDRLLGLEFFVVPVLAGVGVTALIDAAKALGQRASRPSAFRRSVAGAVVAVASLGAVASGVVATWNVTSAEVGANVRVAPRDVAVMEALGAALKPGSLVLNNGTADDGEWITALTLDVEAEPKAYVDSYPDDWRIVAMAGACTDTAAAARALSGMQAVFVGSDQLAGNEHPWTASCMARIPRLRLVAGTTAGPAGFVVSTDPVGT